MKSNAKFVAVIVSLLSAGSMFAQGNLQASLSNEVPTVSTTTQSELVITLKNSSEKKIVIFAGAKEDIRNPRIQEYGGMSTNKLYLKENEVVCLMTAEKKPMSCTIVKPGVATVEVNSSASVIVSK